MSIYLNSRGFNFIEVIIAIVVVSIMAVGLSSLFSVVADTPIITNRRIAYMYAQKEMENLFNKPYNDITTLPRTNYTDDTEFDYEIIVEEPYPEFKGVRVNFYLKDGSMKIAELYTVFIKSGFYICDDFEENGDDYPPWEWNSYPSNRWGVVVDPTDSTNHVYNYRGTTFGRSYPDSFSGSNYKVECKFFIRGINTGTSRLLLGGRVETSTGYGYFIMVNVLVRRIFWFKFAIYTPSLIKINSSGSTTLSTLPSVFEFMSSNYGSVHQIGMEMNGGEISFYFDTNTGNTTDSEFSSGNIMLQGYNLSISTSIFFDDVCVEGE